MSNHVFLKNVSGRTAIRLAQLFLLVIFLWSFFWAHLYDMIFWNKTFFESFSTSSVNVYIYLLSLGVLICFEYYVAFFYQKSRDFKPKSDVTKSIVKQKSPVMIGKKPSNRIGIVFIIVGIVLTVFSVINSVTMVFYVGISLLFFGSLFLFVSNKKFVGTNVLHASLVSVYETFDRHILELNNSGMVYFQAYSVSDGVVSNLVNSPESSVPKEDLYSKENNVQKQLLDHVSTGSHIVPPGFGLVDLFEQQLNHDFTEIDINDFNSALSLILNDLDLASNCEFTIEGDHLTLKLIGSIFYNLYLKEHQLKSIHIVGCPLISAIACALTKVTKKPVLVTKIAVSPNLNAIDANYKLVTGA